MPDESAIDPVASSIAGASEAPQQPLIETDVYCPHPLPPEFAAAIQRLETVLHRKVWLLVHGGPSPLAGGDGFDEIDFPIFLRLTELRRKIPTEPIALVIESPGGSAEAAYRIATAFRRICGHFDVYVPRYAKSAATLLVLGAREIVMGPFAELGPLDVQYTESRRKPHQSSLNESQALDRLHAQALEAFDKTMLLLAGRLALTSDELDQFVPTALNFVSAEFRPLFEKIDLVHWTKVSRLLRIGEDYAVRLLRGRYDAEIAEKIARTLVEAYPDHSFVIDSEEARRIGIDVRAPTEEVAGVMDDILDELNKTPITCVGFLKEVGSTDI